ncbi:hypothetical protein PAHAL_9G375700 [Panicum hallii]|uniref:Uncharacterized protein n=2 Tax=Panicum hallii TaxID=206008 RepID=A0A2T8I3U7_9POAL|nr:hypothetical protein PAHAL_9G375700 [Panicum hallii]
MQQCLRKRRMQKIRGDVKRVRKKEYQNPMETNGSPAPFGDLTNHTNGGAESESNLQSANNSTEHRKRERERTRYATMSQEEKNVRNLRNCEVRQKNKDARCMSFLWCYRYITCNLDGSIFQGCCKLAGSFNTLICFVTLTHVYLLWFWSLCGSHNIRKRIPCQLEFLELYLMVQFLVGLLLPFVLIFVQTICRGLWCIER